MAIINAEVEYSNISDAALNLHAKASELRHTVAGVWNLEHSSSSAPPEITFSSNVVNRNADKVGNGDERQLVDEQHLNHGGKYRSIVKLFIHYEFQEQGAYIMGTGWLIAPDLLVTAGHYSYDWKHKLGRASEVKAYIGYRGRNKIDNPNVEFRTVGKVITTEGWLKNKGQKAYDISFMKVNKPFTNILPFRYEETPATGDMVIGVVGYPSDLTNSATGEKGALMYERFLRTQWNLATQADTMLEYKIDPFGGSSGSPVFRNNDMVAIGTHGYGGALNSASVIGRYGNPYIDYISAFKISVPQDGLSLIKVVRSNTANPNTGASLLTESVASRSQAPIMSSNQRPDRMIEVPPHRPVNAITSKSRCISVKDEESFIDHLKAVVRIMPPVTGNGIGLVGGPVGALGGVALNVSARLAELAEAKFGDIESYVSPSMHQGPLERAILAEAVLCNLQAGLLYPEHEESIFASMEDSFMKALPMIKMVTPIVMSAMMEPALKLALHSLHRYSETRGGLGAYVGKYKPLKPVLYTSSIDDPGDQNVEDFLSFILAALGTDQEAATSGEQSMHADIIRAGLRLGKSALVGGLPIISRAVDAQQSIEVDAHTPTFHSSILAEDLAKRAVMAECALQAVLKLPPHDLDESFFNSLVDNIMSLSPDVLNIAPTVIYTLHPTIERLIRGARGEGSINKVCSRAPPTPNALPPRGRRDAFSTQQSAPYIKK